MLETGEIIEFNGYIMRNYGEIHKYILEKLENYINKSLEMCKSAFNIINTLLLNCSKLFPTEENLRFILDLIKLGIKIINNQN